MLEVHCSGKDNDYSSGQHGELAIQLRPKHNRSIPSTATKLAGMVVTLGTATDTAVSRALQLTRVAGRWAAATLQVG